MKRAQVVQVAAVVVVLSLLMSVSWAQQTTGIGVVRGPGGLLPKSLTPNFLQGWRSVKLNMPLKQVVQTLGPDWASAEWCTLLRPWTYTIHWARCWSYYEHLDFQVSCVYNFNTRTWVARSKKVEWVVNEFERFDVTYMFGM